MSGRFVVRAFHLAPRATPATRGGAQIRRHHHGNRCRHLERSTFPGRTLSGPTLPDDMPSVPKTGSPSDYTEAYDRDPNNTLIFLQVNAGNAPTIAAERPCAHGRIGCILCPLYGQLPQPSRQWPDRVRRCRASPAICWSRPPFSVTEMHFPRAAERFAAFGRNTAGRHRSAPGASARLSRSWPAGGVPSSRSPVHSCLCRSARSAHFCCGRFCRATIWAAASRHKGPIGTCLI